jgi:hypothetical protein
LPQKFRREEPSYLSSPGKSAVELLEALCYALC